MMLIILINSASIGDTIDDDNAYVKDKQATGSVGSSMFSHRKTFSETQ